MRTRNGKKTDFTDIFKKTAALLLSSLLLFAAGGCEKAPGGTDNAGTPEDGAAVTERVTVRLGGLKGPTSMGMVKLLDDAENELCENNYEFSMAASADELTPRFLRGDLDILAVPANLGAVLYNNSNGEVLAAAVNTLGVIYVTEKGGETVNTLSDLAGRTVYATGKGSTPEYALGYLLDSAGLKIGKGKEDVNVEWKNEPSEVVAQMALEDNAVAMLPQPFVTVAAGQLDHFRIALDLTEIWDRLDTESRFITAALIVRKTFAKEHPEALKTFLDEYAESSDYVNQNPDEAAPLVEKYGIVKAAVAKKAIPYCNIVCITGDEMKNSLSAYFEILYAQSHDAVGGKLPGDDFYLIY